MRLCSISVALLSLASGCEYAAPDAPDASVPDAAPAATSTITVDTGEVPALVVYRHESSSTWQQAILTTPTTFELAVSEPYRVTVICDESYRPNRYYRVWQEARTLDDDHRIEVSCDTAPRQFNVTGTMMQTGSVTVDSGTMSGNGSWSFAIAAKAKQYALVATSPDRIEVRRDLVVQSDLSVTPPIDVASGGSFIEQSLVPTNLNGTETDRAEVWLEARHTRAQLYTGPSAVARLAPQSVLDPTDRQLVTVSGTAPSGTRYVTRDMRVGDSTSFTLPPPLTTVGFANRNNKEVTATWSKLPELDVVRVTLDQGRQDAWRRSHQLTMSKRFIDATDATKATIDTASIPGFDERWEIDTRLPHNRSFTAERNVSAAESAGTTIAESVSAPL